MTRDRVRGFPFLPVFGCAGLCGHFPIVFILYSNNLPSEGL